MGEGSMRIFLAAGLALLLGSSCAAADVERYVCKRVSGGPIADFMLTVDEGANKVDISPGMSFSVQDPDEVKITKSDVSWDFMRGFVDFDRASLKFVWDETAEYGYLMNIGHTPDDPESNYCGVAQCTRMPA